MNTRKICILTYILLLLYGCNSEVFIDNYFPESDHTVALSEEQPIQEITFASGNWGVYSIEGAITYQLEVAISTPEGESTNLPFHEGELGSIRCKSQYVDLLIEKSTPSKLKFIYQENLLDHPLTLNLNIGNEYQHDTLTLTLMPTQKYQLDSIVYRWEEFDLSDYGAIDLMESWVVNNTQGDTPVSVWAYPYRNTQRSLSFYPYSNGGYWDEEMFRRYFGTPLPEIIIPDIVDKELPACSPSLKNDKMTVPEKGNRKPELKNTKVAFGIGQQQLDTHLDKTLKVECTVNAHDCRKICVYNLAEHYNVPFKVYASHPKTGKKREFSGYLYSTNYIDYTIFLQKEETNATQLLPNTLH